MPAVVLLIIILLVVFLVLKSVHDARDRSAEGTGDGESGEGAKRTVWTQRRGRQKPASPSGEIDREALSTHVTKLREAVAHGLISTDEAAASVVRHTDGELSEESARQLLDSDDEAA